MSLDDCFIDCLFSPQIYSEAPKYRPFLKSFLNHFSYLAQYADENQKKFTNCFALPEEEPYKLVCAALTNPDTTKLATDMETALAEIEEDYLSKIEKDLEMKSEEVIEEKQIRAIGLWNWQGIVDYRFEKNSQLNEGQRLQILAKLFLLYNKRLSKILETVKMKIDEIKSNPEESSLRFQTQCRRLQPAVDKKYEEVKKFPHAIDFFKDNAIDRLISEKQLNEDEIPISCFQRFTQDDLFRHLVYRRLVDSRSEATDCEATEETLCNDAAWNERLKAIVSQLPSIMKIKRADKITGFHVASLIKWFRDKMKEGARMDVKIIQKSLLSLINKKLGKDYKIFEKPSNISEAIKILDHKSTKVSQETMAEHDKDYAAYKKALDENVALSKGQQSA